MRGCLTILVGGLLFLLVLAWFALPAFSGGVILVGLAASGLSGTGTTVTVDASPPLELLTLHADAVHIRSSAVTWHGLDAATLALDLGDVELGSRTFKTLTGHLTDARLTTSDGETRIRTIDLTGSSERADAVLSVEPSVVATLATAAAERALGEPPSEVRLAAPDRVTASIGSRVVSGRLVVDQTGALVVELPAFGRAVVAQPGSDVPVRFTGVTIEADGGLTLRGTLDLAALGLSG